MAAIWLAAALAATAQGAAPADAAGAPGLAARVEAVLRTPGYEHGHWGLLVVDGRTGAVVFERSPDAMVRPASVTKLFSTAAALADLGAEHRFVTPVVHTGTLDAETGVLKGNLILVAQGDPSLGGRTGPDGTLLFEDNDHSYAGPGSRSTIVPADPLAGIDHLARDVLAAGVKAIDGDVLVDDRLFEPAESTGSGPRLVTPIVVNDNLVDVVVTPGASAGEPATVRIVPETAFVSVDAQVQTVAADAGKRVTVEPVGPRRFLVRGRVPVGGGPSYHAYEVEEPASFARALFLECLRRRGITVAGATPLGDNDSKALPSRTAVAALPKLAQFTSPPFGESVRVILKVSQNLHASTLPLLIAAQHGERTLADGLRREGDLLRGLGVDIGTISFGGGAGGSPADLVTPRATVALLRAMAARPDFSTYEAALPILGRDGTLALAVDGDSPARGHARAKTGTYYVRDGLTGKTILTSKALAGYLETDSGRNLIFAFFVNDLPLVVTDDDVSAATAAAGRVLGRLCEVFYSDSDSDREAAGSSRPTPTPPAPARVEPGAPAPAMAPDPPAPKAPG